MMLRSSRLRLAVVVTLGALVAQGCAKSDAEVDKELLDAWLKANGPTITTHLDRLTEIAKLATAHAELKDDSLDVADLKIRENFSKQKTGNTEVLGLPDLVEPGKAPSSDVATPTTRTSFIHELASFVAGGELPEDMALTYQVEPTDPPRTYKLDQHRDGLLSLKYVAVVKETYYSKGMVMDASNFVAGIFQADVLIYRVEDAKYMGGVLIGVKNSPTVDVTYTDIADRYLHSDIEDSIKPVAVLVIEAALAK